MKNRSSDRIECLKEAVNLYHRDFIKGGCYEPASDEDIKLIVGYANLIEKEKRGKK